jgi:putative ABC transport system ATP-binding protein
MPRDLTDNAASPLCQVDRHARAERIVRPVGQEDVTLSDAHVASMLACASPPPCLLVFRAVSHIYRGGAKAHLALSEVSFQIHAGGFVAVAGPSGSGKSTLLNLAAGIEDPTAGCVQVDGRDLAAMSEGERSAFRLRHVGLVFQNANLVPVLTVAENVELPLLFRREWTRHRQRKQAAEALHALGLWDKRDQRPHELSGGECQRAAIARALAGDPAIVLADEPTASLDRQTGASLIALMRKLNRELGTTFVYATHDPELIGDAGDVLCLRDGRIEGIRP